MKQKEKWKIPRSKFYEKEKVREWGEETLSDRGCHTVREKKGDKDSTRRCASNVEWWVSRVTESRRVQLSKNVVETWLQVRVHHWTSTFNMDIELTVFSVESNLFKWYDISNGLKLLGARQVLGNRHRYYLSCADIAAEIAIQIRWNFSNYETQRRFTF